jgi:glycine/D-amino acid oxidase-like deaminating enzyme
MGHAGFSAIPRLLQHLDQHKIRQSLGLKIEPVLVSLDSMKDIPKEYADLCLPMPHSTILHILETEESEFIAAINAPKGCMNSALFCEELAGFMVTMYGDRLHIAEHLPVETVILEGERATLKTTGPSIAARKVVLCTNGFENLEIEHRSGPPIAPSFYALVQGLIGYMAGYMDSSEKPSAAISYYGKGTSHLDPYTYITRRPFQRTDSHTRNLVCVGGPERILPDRASYDPESAFPSDVEEELERSLELIRPKDEEKPLKAFSWHGVMGYTRTGVRCIGAEPLNSTLLYNLGCNGVGILPSIFGAKRIAQILNGKKLAPSLFDPAAAA